MSFTLKHLTWAMALAMSTQAIMVASAHAEDMLPGDPLTVTYPPTPFSPNGSSFTYGPGYAVSRQSTLSLSSDALAMLDTARITVSSPGTAHIALDPDGYYMDATFTTGSTKNLVKLDDATHAVLGVNATGGDIVFTAFQAIKSVTSGGSLTLHDLTVSLTDNTIYASLDGANGVGSLSRVALFTYDNVTLQMTQGPVAPPPCYPNGAPFCDNMSLTHEGTQRVEFNLADADLHFTQQGRDVFNQSLGLLTLGHSALQGLDTVAVLSLNVAVDAVPGYFAAASVPEPGTMALMGLGLVGLFSRARSSRSCGRSA